MRHPLFRCVCADTVLIFQKVEAQPILTYTRTRDNAFILGQRKNHPV